MKIVLAGAEAYFRELLLGLKAPNILMTYFYLRNQDDSGVASVKRAHDQGAWIIIDSGAFSLKSRFVWLDDFIIEPGSDGITAKPQRFPQKMLDEAREKANNRSKADVIDEIRAYFDAYAKFIVSAHDYADAFAELDVEGIVGSETTWEWRHALLNACDGNAHKVIISPHGRMLEEAEMKRIFATFKYIGLARPNTKHSHSDFFNRWMPELKKNKVLVHGWAMTTFDAITQYPFYSVDSTTWLMGGKYGVTYVYDGSLKLDSHSAEWKPNRHLLKEDAALAGADFEKFLADVPDEVHKVNAYQWIKYARDMESYLTNAYWIDQSEKSKIVSKAREDAGLAGPMVKRDRYSDLMPAGSGPAMSIARLCNTCFLNQKCPAFVEDSTCSIATRPEIRADQDLERVANAAIALQFERYEFATFAERVLGAPANPETGREGKTLLEMMKAKRDIFDTRDSIKIEARGGGILSKMFASLGQKKEQTQEVERVSVERVEEAETTTVRAVEETNE